MADAMSSESSAPSTTSAESATQGAASANQGLDALKKQMEAQSAIIRRLSDKLEKIGEPKEKEKPKGPISNLNEEVAKIRSQLDAERQKSERARLVNAQQSIKAQLSEGGVDPALARMASETVLNRIRGHLQFQDDGTGQEIPVITSEDGTAQTLGEFLSSWMQSDEGKALNPGKPAPSLFGTPRGNGNSFSGKIRATQADLLAGRVKTADVLAGKVVLVDAD